MVIQRNRTTLLGSTILLACLAAVPANSQQTTEQFIPIGASPGVSRILSYIGEVVAVDPATHTVTIRDEAGTYSFIVTNATRIWLDRSARKRENTTGTYADCEVGRTIEVMHLLDDTRTAAWIKIRTR